MDDELIVCRCEEVTAGEIRRAIRDGARDLSAVKRRTRAGMGLCQGRTCESLVVRLLCKELGLRAGDVAPASPRPPVVPVPFGAIGDPDEADH
ncbi:MAG: (2Fe-2S)-binding protein [Firmicutes bacterium]|nr:(2Fe-2S)-binding protein [Bacillota bacterium]